MSLRPSSKPLPTSSGSAAEHARLAAAGPRILFFSGGTALRGISREIVARTHNSVHLVTPFDSGGSSARLREAFAMPAVGDIRNRILALADRSLPGVAKSVEFFGLRLPENAGPEALRAELEALVEGTSSTAPPLPGPLAEIARRHLATFLERMPEDFDLAGASIGNLVLTGAYLRNDRRLNPAIGLLSELVRARGTVRAVVEEHLHLACELEDGSVLVGQHRITGKEEPPITSPVRRVFLSRSPTSPEPARPEIPASIRELILGAGLICFPMGSFHSSLIATLLPSGVGRAVRAAPCPKVHVPNLGHDPEQLGRSLPERVRFLCETLRADCGEPEARSGILDVVLVDPERGDYGQGADLSHIREMGVEVVEARLVSDRSRPLLDDRLVLERLLALV